MVSPPLPMFPLGTVVFPGMNLPVHVFEDRYRALVEHLLAEPDPAARVFGVVAIREGYEVGDHGAQSLYRVGCLVQASEITPRGDGSYDLLALGRHRIRVESMVPGADFPQALHVEVPEPAVEVPEELLVRARATFTAFRAVVSQLREDPHPGALPRDPEYLSWTLSALAPLPMAERQSLLEAGDAAERLATVVEYLREELRAMNAIPSLPATQMARTAWSPN